MAKTNPFPNRRRQPLQPRAQQTLDALFTATAKILETHGEKGLSTNKIAEQAGLSVGTLYQYFENKEQLVWAMAVRGQTLVMKTLEDYLDPLESDRAVAQRDPYQILRGIVAIFVEGFARGKMNARGKANGRALIRLAWSCENLEESAAFANQMGNRLHLFFENIHHPELAPPNSAQLFVLVQSVLGVLRYASLERSPLLNSAALEHRLTQMLKSIFEKTPWSCEPVFPVHVAPPDLTQAHSSDMAPSLRPYFAKKRTGKSAVAVFRALVQVLDAVGERNLQSNELAFRAGISQGTISQHFPDKKKMVWTAGLYSVALVYAQFDALSAALEDNGEFARRRSVQQLIRDGVTIYNSGTFRAGRLFAVQTVSRSVYRLGWMHENLEDISFFADSISKRIQEFWERIQHPDMSRSIPSDVLYVAMRGYIGVVRMALLQQSPLMNSPAFDDALVQLWMVIKKGD